MSCSFPCGRPRGGSLALLLSVLVVFVSTKSENNRGKRKKRHGHRLGRMRSTADTHVAFSNHLPLLRVPRRHLLDLSLDPIQRNGFFFSFAFVFRTSQPWSLYYAVDMSASRARTPASPHRHPAHPRCRSPTQTTLFVAFTPARGQLYVSPRPLTPGPSPCHRRLTCKPRPCRPRLDPRFVPPGHPLPCLGLSTGR